MSDRTTTRAPAATDTALARLTDDELQMIAQRTWGVNPQTDRTILDHLARRGVDVPCVKYLTLTVWREIDARLMARESSRDAPD